MDKFEFAQRFQADKAKYYRIAYSYVKNEHDALDVMGEASYKALRSLKALKTPEYFSSWMTRIVINCALDLLRQNSRVTFLDDALPPESETRPLWRRRTRSTSIPRSTRSGNGIAPASSCTSLRVTPTKTSPGYSGSRNRL